MREQQVKLSILAPPAFPYRVRCEFCGSGSHLVLYHRYTEPVRSVTFS